MPRTRHVLLAALVGLILVPETPGQEPRRRPRTEPSEPFVTAGPDLGDPAPELELLDLDGTPINLSDLWSERPLILVLGSITSAEFRASVDELERLGTAFGVHAGVVAIYTVEAHPTGSESPYAPGTAGKAEGNPEVGQPKTLEERRAAARSASEQLTFGSLTWLVDDMDNRAWQAYGPAPNTAFLIEGGYVTLRQTWFDPVEMDRTVRQLIELRRMNRELEEAPQVPEAPEPPESPESSQSSDTPGAANPDGGER